MNIDLTIGWTKSDMENGYSSYMDGYRPGAEQHTETVTVEVEDTVPSHDVVTSLAESVFMATNAPYEVTGLEGQIREAIAATGYRGQGAHYSLSTGDTVTVGEVTMECSSFGWKQISLTEVCV